jgi:hypothetical protein
MRSSFLTIVITHNRQPMAVLRPKRKRRVAPPNAESERERYRFTASGDLGNLRLIRGLHGQTL